MRNLKKLLAVLVVVTVMLTAIVPAFAATPTVGASASDAVKTAVSELGALGVVVGDSSGAYNEGNNLTRAEFAKMLVVALNLNNAAKAATGASKFSDVPAGQWYTGYVNVAASKGIVAGRPDFTFGPNDPVTYAEAVTMVVRALGYKDAWLDGTWPANFINQADSLGLLSDLSSLDGNSNRGDAAVLLKNALETPMVVASGFGTDTTYEVSNPAQTILSNKLDITSTDSVTFNSSSLSDSTIDPGDVKGTTTGGTKTYGLTNGLDENTLLGETGTIWTNSDGNIIYFIPDTAASDVITGTITSPITASKIKVTDATGTETEYTVDAGATVLSNNAASNTAGLTANKYGKFVLNSDGNISFANVYAFTNNALLVTTVDATNMYIKGYSATSSPALVKVDMSQQDGVKVFGAASDLSGIQANDIVSTVDLTDNGSNYTYLFDERDSVSGSFDRTAPDSSSMRIAGTDYDTTASYTSYSLDNGATKPSAFASSASISDAMGTDVTAYLDLKGGVRYITATADSKSAINYGIVTGTGTDSDLNTIVKIYDPATDATAVYQYTSSDLNNWAPANKQVVAYTLDSDGAINAVDVISDMADGAALTNVGGAGTTLTAVYEKAQSFNSDYNYIALGTTTNKTLITDSTILATYAQGTDAPAVVQWDNINTQDPNNTVWVTGVKDGNVGKFIAFGNGYSTIGSGADWQLAIVTDRYTTSDGNMADLLFTDGTTKTVQDVNNATDANDAVIYKPNADGNIQTNVIRAVYGDTYADQADSGALLTTATFDVVYGTVDSFDSDNILVMSPAASVNGTCADNTFIVSSDLPVYVMNDDGSGTVAGSTADISEGLAARVIVSGTDKTPVAVIVLKHID